MLQPIRTSQRRGFTMIEIAIPSPKRWSRLESLRAFQPSPTGATKLGITSPMTLAETRLFGVSLLGLSDEALTDVLVARLA